MEMKLHMRERDEKTLRIRMFEFEFGFKMSLKTVCASKLWNNIPVRIRQSVSVNAFKKALKAHLLPN